MYLCGAVVELFVALPFVQIVCLSLYTKCASISGYKCVYIVYGYIVAAQFAHYKLFSRPEIANGVWCLQNTLLFTISISNGNHSDTFEPSPPTNHPPVRCSFDETYIYTYIHLSIYRYRIWLWERRWRRRTTERVVIAINSAHIGKESRADKSPSTVWTTTNNLFRSSVMCRLFSDRLNCATSKPYTVFFPSSCHPCYAATYIYIYIAFVFTLELLQYIANNTEVGNVRAAKCTTTLRSVSSSSHIRLRFDAVIAF